MVVIFTRYGYFEFETPIQHIKFKLMCNHPSTYTKETVTVITTCCERCDSILSRLEKGEVSC